jgi:hypothetical protein
LYFGLAMTVHSYFSQSGLETGGWTSSRACFGGFGGDCLAVVEFISSKCGVMALNKLL